jgi:FkbH-like protein
MRLTLRPLTPGNRQRVLQLIAKTNQFNATSRRHGERDLDRLQAEGAELVAAVLSDRLAPGEDTIGVLVLRYTEYEAVVDTLLLSCRVLGRGVETALLAWAVSRGRARGCTRLRGEIRETPRNEPVRGLYPDHGFTAAAGGFVLDLGAAGVAVPPWIRLADEVPAAALSPAAGPG